MPSTGLGCLLRVLCMALLTLQGHRCFVASFDVELSFNEDKTQGMRSST